MKLINLGCGQRFHKEWINVDFHSDNEHVIGHNLLKGIPFNDFEFDAVYHSHVLEHFSKEDGKQFIAECYRVLKPGGIIRVAVPDLEQIVKNYLKAFEGALAGDADSAANYEWMMLELYDQTVRNFSGGEMAKYFQKDEMKNEKFVFSRVGEEGRVIRENFLKSNRDSKNGKIKTASQKEKVKNSIRKIRNILLRNESEPNEKKEKLMEIGQFRLGGEVHQWMYDRYSLSKLLSETGLQNITVKTAFESEIKNWNDYQLESKNGLIFKPDSLFMEGQKL
ncbi:MAG: methyltransferase domain-containing protein [Bacteroidia bacterium]